MKVPGVIRPQEPQLQVDDIYLAMAVAEFSAARRSTLKGSETHDTSDSELERAPKPTKQTEPDDPEWHFSKPMPTPEQDDRTEDSSSRRKSKLRGHDR